ncbi:MAG: hypothetical protein JO170_10125 [Verrucomicrobia bacterium]|nr:hypothetical protein [Verrucomicrobiota bacterium]
MSAFSNIDISAALQQVLTAFSQNAGVAISATALVQHQFSQYIEDLENLQDSINDGTVSPALAQNVVDSEKASLDAAIQAATGLRLVAVQNAVNTALKVLEQILGTALSSALKL